METTKVKDLMASLDQFAIIPEDATIFEAVATLEEARQKAEVGAHPYRAALVADKTGKVVGKLGILDVLRALEPRYGEISDLKKLSGFGLSSEFLKSMMDKFDMWKSPLDDLCRKAAERKVGAVVSSPLENEVIDQEASLNQALHQLIMGHFQSLLVTSKGAVVGILRLTDVFQYVTDRIKACAI